jgi:hypothetical protein
MIPAAMNKSRRIKEQSITKEFFVCRRNTNSVEILFSGEKNFEIIAIFTLAFRDRTIRVSTAKVRIYYAPKLTLGGGATDKPIVSRVSQT